MSKILKVTIEYDDKIITLEGEEAEKWQQHGDSLSTMASIRAGNQNPFDTDPVKWKTEIKDLNQLPPGASPVYDPNKK